MPSKHILILTFIEGSIKIVNDMMIHRKCLIAVPASFEIEEATQFLHDTEHFSA